MDFLQFAKLHGILIDRIPPVGVWRRYPTEDHPAKRNGAVKFMLDHAFIQNWATSTEVVVWKSDSEAKIDHDKIRRIAAQGEQQIRERQQKAAGKAAWILKQCQFGYHPYLEKKGFKDEQGNIWKSDDGLLLVIPMRVGQHLVGCQLINEEGQKKFLFGQRTSGASFVFDNHGPTILCEGYATALSVRAVMKSLKRRYTLYVCFSAGNMAKMAACTEPGFLIADNDQSQTGERTAKEIGWQYFMPPDVGQDFNDYAMRVGLFKASQSLMRSLPLR